MTNKSQPIAPSLANITSEWSVFWIASIAVFLVSIDTTVLYAGFNKILLSFPESSAADVSWAMTAYSIVYATMLIPAGGIADKYGRKKIFLLGVLVFILASFACGAATSVAWLIAARVVQAIGACLLSPAALSLILEAFSHHKRAVVMSAWGAVGALAAALGPGVGSFIIDTLGWQWAFYMNIPIGCYCLWRGSNLLNESSHPKDKVRLDIIGMLLLMLGIGAITFSIVEFNSPQWQRADLAKFALAGVALILGFVAWAKVKTDPLVDLALFKNKTFVFANLAGMSFGIAFVIMFFSFFFWMTSIWHYSQSLAGLAIMPGPLTVIPTALVAGRIASKIGHRKLLITGCLTYAMSGLWFMLVPDQNVNYLAHWLPGLLLSGFSVGLVMPSLTAAAVHGLPTKDYAVGSAVNHAIRQIGAVIGVAITVLMLAHSNLQYTDFKITYFCHVVLALLSALLVIPINTHPNRMQR